MPTYICPKCKVPLVQGFMKMFCKYCDFDWLVW